MSWYCLTLTDAEVATGKLSECKNAFEAAFATARGPRLMALFQGENDAAGTPLFFTPECGQHAAALLDQWGCQPCERPSLIGLQLLVGHNEITYYMPP